MKDSRSDLGQILDEISSRARSDEIGQIKDEIGSRSDEVFGRDQISYESRRDLMDLGRNFDRDQDCTQRVRADQAVAEPIEPWPSCVRAVCEPLPVAENCCLLAEKVLPLAKKTLLLPKN